MQGKCLGLLVVLSVLAGCRIRTGDLTIAATQLTELDKIDLDASPVQRGVEGRSSVWIILFFPLGVPNLQSAIDDALDQGGGDLMTDVALYREEWWFLVGQSAIIAEGDVINTRRKS